MLLDFGGYILKRQLGPLPIPYKERAISAGKVRHGLLIALAVSAPGIALPVYTCSQCFEAAVHGEAANVLELAASPCTAASPIKYCHHFQNSYAS